ncbi:DinB family protein [Vibrio cyclitrophicus]
MSFTIKRNFQKFASYNLWTNDRLYRHLAKMNPDILTKNSGAFFGSAFSILHHILNCDLIWLNRFSKLPCDHELASDLEAYSLPSNLSAINYVNLNELLSVRGKIDKIIVLWIDSLSEDTIQMELTYNNSSGKSFTAPCIDLITHFFNHQTHHRGQLTTILSQNGDNTYKIDYLEFLKGLKKQ